MARQDFTFDESAVLFEDNHLIIVNKKAGVLVQGDATGDAPLVELVKGYLKHKYQKQGAVFLGTPHRIDRPTSGLVIFAKTSKALSRMNQLFRDGNIEKTYWAWVQNKPEPSKNTLTHYLLKNPKNNKATVFPRLKKGAKKAVLHYELKLSLERYHLLKIQLATGRHHQIRAQLSFIKCPIKGDLKYGSPSSNPNGSIHLHARNISFVHPIRQTPLSITAPLPTGDKLWQWVE